MAEVSLMTVVISGAIAALTVLLSLVLYQVFRILAEVRRELGPILANAKKMSDEISKDLERVDGLMQSAERIGEKAEVTGEIAQEVISSPLIKMAAVSAGFRKALTVLARRG